MPIALLTDFGTRDPYVAAMKGVLATRTVTPVLDLTHDIAPFDVFGAAWFLGTIVQYWPAGTIFVCIVDPGVGSARRILAAERDGRLFLAPDNGLLTFAAFAEHPSSAFGTFSPRARGTKATQADAARDSVAFSPPRGEKVPQADEGCYSVENTSLFLPHGSNTFHGRDRFAPVAAALANGLPIGEVGPRTATIALLDYEPPAYGETFVEGTVVAIDRFGNVITDIEASRVPFALRLEQNYADAPAGVFRIVGSTGHIELSVKNGNAADELRMTRGQRVGLTPL
jgi:S-adenosylmethionine hydrolase